MGGNLTLFFPLIPDAGFAVAYFKNLLTSTQALCLVVGITVAYYLVLAILAGVFASCKAEERIRGPFTYYYRNYQGDFGEVTISFMNLFTKEQNKVLFAGKGVASLGLYWDDPWALVNPHLARSCIGYVITPQVSKEAIDMLQSIGFLKEELPQWKCVEANMRVRIDLAYMVAPMKLIPAIVNYIEKKYPEVFDPTKEYPVYEYCENMQETIYGEVVGAERAALEKLVPFKRPQIKESWLRDQAARAAKKKAQ